MVKSTLYLKKRLPLSASTSLNAKAELHCRLDSSRLPSGLDAVLKTAQGSLQTRLELSTKLLNATSSQDVRLRVGLDPAERSLYLELRENRLCFKAQLSSSQARSWSVLYDL